MEVCQRTFFYFFYRRPPKAVIEASRARWVLRLRRVYSGLLCTPSNLMYTQQTHEIFRPPRTLVRLATPLLLRRERRRSARGQARHHGNRRAPKDRMDHHR